MGIYHSLKGRGGGTDGRRQGRRERKKGNPSEASGTVGHHLGVTSSNVEHYVISCQLVMLAVDFLTPRIPLGWGV